VTHWLEISTTFSLIFWRQRSVEWVCDIGDAAMQIDHMQNHPGEPWRGEGGIYVFFVSRRRQLPTGSRGICFTPPAQKFSINVCRKCQKDAESSMAIVVKPTCAKIYLRSRADRVATTTAPKGSRDICFTPQAQIFSINVCRKCQKARWPLL
jgi:ribosomal protein L40E